jgi:hypothetical protein
MRFGPTGPGRGPANFGPPQQEFGPPQGFGPPQSFAPPGGEFSAAPAPSGDLDFFSFANPVPFFEWTLSPFVFTLLLQTGLIVTMATMAIRRWQKEDKHSLSKVYALGVLAAFLLLLIGNIWPVITRDFLPFPILGETDLDSLAVPISIVLPLMYTVLILVLCVFLFANTVPTHNAYVRGVRRAKKLNRRAAWPWEDDAANIPFMCLFVLLALTGFWVVYHQMSSANYLDFLEGTRYGAWRLPLAFALVLFNAFLLLQVLERRGTVLTCLLLWLLPVLIGVVSAAAMEQLTSLHTVLASLSPLATMLMAGVLPIEATIPFNPPDEFNALYTGSTVGLIFVAVQSGLLVLRWRQLRRSLR